MAGRIVAFLCLSVISFALADHNSYINGYQKVIDDIAQNATSLRILEQREHDYSKRQEMYVGPEFPCPIMPPSPTIPTSVHKLRPADIQVVAAMGDSVTAGMGADAGSILGMLNDYRGLSWSIGGDSTYDKVETLPNILKKYNPKVKGFSVGKGDDLEDARFNVAVSGSESNNLPSQARTLIDRMKNDPEVDFANDWKVITIMSGANDICHVCDKPDKFSPDIFTQHLTTTLDMLKAEVPRALVNLVETINVQMAKDLNKGLICTIVHVACPCAAFPKNKEAEAKLVTTVEEFHTRTEELVTSGRYDVSDDFTVVVQPFLKETFAPKTEKGKIDMSYFAPDCFHLSRKGQAAAANALWDNMVEKVGNKKVTWTPGDAIECPTEASPYFFTSKNGDTTLRHPAREEQFIEVPEIIVIRERMAPPKPHGGDYWSNRTIILGSAFLALALIGLVLTIVWAWRRSANFRSSRTSKTSKTSKTKVGGYSVMEEDTVWEKYSSPPVYAVNKHVV